jgi:YD repeat-containing protein
MKALSAAVAALLFLPAAASAHAVVFPATSKPGAYEKYTLRVPNEKTSATTQVRIDFPRDLRVVSFAEAQGWTLTLGRDSAQRITSATWTGSLQPQRFVELSFVAVNPRAPMAVQWPVHQTYADGQTVHWTGAKDSKNPASITEIGDPKTPGGFESWVGLAALALSLIALGLVLRRNPDPAV